MTDLECLFADPSAQLTTSLERAPGPDGNRPEFRPSRFDRGTLPTPPAELTTSALCIVSFSHSYGSLTVDAVNISAYRAGYRAFGLFILAGLLTPGPQRFTLFLTHPASHVRRIVFDTMYRRSTRRSGGLRSEAISATYLPARRSRCARTAPATDVPPDIRLTDADGVVSRDWPGDPARDTLFGFSSDAGAYAIAELCLDVSQEWNEETEYTLEGPQGFGGVGAHSAEITLFLPGSVGWNAGGWPETPDGYVAPAG